MILKPAQLETHALDAATWSLKIADGLTLDEERAFNAWLEEEANADALEAVMTTWASLGEARSEPRLLRLRSAALDDCERAGRSRWLAPPLAGKKAALAMAASLLLVLLGAFYIAMLPDIYRTEVGERRMALLEDGSKISLDADTVVEVDYHRSQRELRLIRGRAKFDVAKDPLRPFTVLAGNQLVVATGTSFSVEVLAAKMQVLLYEGRVEILETGEDATRRPAGSKAYERNRSLAVPGTQLETGFAPGARDVLIKDMHAAPSWEMGELAFDDEPLDDVLLRFNRYSKVDLVSRDPAARQTRISGVFRADDLGGFLEAVHEINGLRIERAGNMIYLSAPQK